MQPHEQDHPLVRRLGIVGLMIGSFLSLLWLSHRVSLGFDHSDSLPFSVYVLIKNPDPLSVDDYVVFYPGDNPFYRDDHLLVKKVLGVQGDVIHIEQDRLQVGERMVGFIKKQTRRGQSLTAQSLRVVPEHHYFVAGDHIDSFDSRYQELGLVHHSQVIAKAVPLW